MIGICRCKCLLQSNPNNLMVLWRHCGAICSRAGHSWDEAVLPVASRRTEVTRLATDYSPPHPLISNSKVRLY